MKKTKYATPISIIEKMIKNGELGEYTNKKTLGGVLSIAQNLIPMIGGLGALFESKVNNNVNPAQENVNPYGYREGGKLVNGFTQYDAASHEEGGQKITMDGTPAGEGTNEVEKQENFYKYKNIPDKKGYVFSDKNGTADQVKEIIKKYFKKNPDLDEPTRTAMELEINAVEGKNEVLKAKSEAADPNVLRMGGEPDPNMPTPFLPTLPLNPVYQGNYITPQLNNGNIKPVESQQTATNQLTALPDVVFPGQTKSKLDITLPNADAALRTAVLGLNTLGLLNKPEKENLIAPDYTKADERMGRMNYSLDAARDAALSSQNANSNAIRSGSSSFQSMLARELQNSANLNSTMTNINMQEQGTRNQIDQTVASYEANKAVDLTNRKYQNKIDNLQNQAQNRNIKRAILGDTLAEADRMSTIKNNELIINATVAETQSLLNSIYPDFAITDEWITKAKQLSKGEITEADYSAFVQNQSPIKFKG